MSAIQKFVGSLRERGVEFRLENGELRYRAPKGTLTPGDVDELKAQKQDIIAFLTSEKPVPLKPVGPQPRVGDLPLILTQETWWFLQNLGVFAGAALNVSKAVRLNFAVDDEILERCFREIVARHESLRARIAVVSDKPVQVIDETTTIDLHRIDLSDVAYTEKEKASQHIVQRIAYTTYDPAKDPALTCSLIKLADDEYILVTVLQHIMADGWSLKVLYDELLRLYIAFLQQQPSPLAPLPLQCADYALWQRDVLETLLARQLPYWRELVADSKQLLLPSTRSRPDMRSYRAGVVCFTVDAEEAMALYGLAKSQQTTPFIVLLASYMALLGAWSGEDDVLISTPFAGRNRAEVQGLIGCFLSSIILRTDLSGDPTFAQLMQNCRKTTFGAYSNSDIEILMLSQLLGMRFSDISINFNVEDAPSSQVLQALAAPRQDGKPAVSNIPLNYQMHWDTYPAEIALEIVERNGTFACYLLYACDIFDAEIIERFVNIYQAILKHVCSNPEAKLSELPCGSALQA